MVGAEPLDAIIPLFDLTSARIGLVACHRSREVLALVHERRGRHQHGQGGTNRGGPRRGRGRRSASGPGGDRARGSATY